MEICEANLGYRPKAGIPPPPVFARSRTTSKDCRIVVQTKSDIKSSNPEKLWRKGVIKSHLLKMSQFRAHISFLQIRRWQRLFILLLTLGVLFAARPVNGSDFFVSPDGNDNNDGTINSPFKTIEKAMGQAQPGDTIFLRGGLYVYSQTIRITKSGVSENPITLCSYQEEVPILDFQNVGVDDSGIRLDGSYWHLRGFTIQYAGHNGLRATGSDNIMEQLVTRSNGDTGLHLTNPASCNLVLNCDSYFNYDPEEHGQDADGFGAKFDIGEGNLFKGCRAWNNSDDGFDFWEAGNGVTVEDCWSFYNGDNIWEDPLFAGNANGFKLGHGSGGHVLIRCLAYDHRHHGIDVNGNLTGVQVYNCTCAASEGKNFYFDEHSDTHRLRNNLSHLGSVLIYEEINHDYNSWNGFTVSDSDFVTLDPNGLDGPRKPDGGLPKMGFLRLSPTSSLIDAGIDVGLVFEGDAPDLGAFEYLVGDCQGDGDVDLGDLGFLVSNWLDVDCGDCNGADLDGNGEVNLDDFGKLAGNWLK